MPKRITVSRRGGAIPDRGGDDYIDVTAACEVVPDSLKDMSREMRRRNRARGYDDQPFDNRLSPVLAKVKTGTAGIITIGAVFTYSHLERRFGSLVPHRATDRLKRGEKKWRYEFRDTSDAIFHLHITSDQYPPAINDETSDAFKASVNSGFRFGSYGSFVRMDVYTHAKSVSSQLSFNAELRVWGVGRTHSRSNRRRIRGNRQNTNTAAENIHGG